MASIWILGIIGIQYYRYHDLGIQSPGDYVNNAVKRETNAAVSELLARIPHIHAGREERDCGAHAAGRGTAYPLYGERKSVQKAKVLCLLCYRATPRVCTCTCPSSIYGTLSAKRARSGRARNTKTMLHHLGEAHHLYDMGNMEVRCSDLLVGQLSAPLSMGRYYERLIKDTATLYKSRLADRYLGECVHLLPQPTKLHACFCDGHLRMQCLSMWCVILLVVLARRC